jgi:hypothetical protein
MSADTTQAQLKKKEKQQLKRDLFLQSEPSFSFSIGPSYKLKQ